MNGLVLLYYACVMQAVSLGLESIHITNHPCDKVDLMSKLNIGGNISANSNVSLSAVIFLF